MTRSSLLLLLLSSLPALPAAWTQDRFVISAWVDPIVNTSQFDAEYARFAASGFTALLGGFGATSPPAVALQVAACARAGLACIPASCESPAGPNPGGSCVTGASDVMGYQLYDEPQPAAFPNISAWFARLAVAAPGKLRFVNLLPNYADFAPPGGYRGYLRAFVDTVRPDLLCFDHYPLFYPGSATDAASNTSQAGYLRNLADVREASLAAGIPFWNFFNAMPFNGRPDVTEAQLRWQVYSSLAYGAKGVLYFCYWSPTGASFAWGNALITPRALPGGAPVYVPGPHLAQAARINAKLGVYGAYLLNATSTGTALAGGAGAGGPQQPGVGPLAWVQGAIASPANVPWSALAGAFALPARGGAALLLHNQDADYPVIFRVGWAGGAAASEVDGATGAVAPALDDAPGTGEGFNVALEAGDARLFVFPAAAAAA